MTAQCFILSLPTPVSCLLTTLSDLGLQNASFASHICFDKRPVVYLCFLSGAVGVLDCCKFSSLAGEGSSGICFSFSSAVCLFAKDNELCYCSVHRVNYFAVLQLND